ncbi:MAG: acetylornithine transaminase [Armatimonadota bacterium]|nr:acetylornithine transaminase [Armatimonadota bacterium]
MNVKTVEQQVSNVIELDSKYVMRTYARMPVVFVRGEGCFLYDADGKEYLDFVAGIAVNGLGHCHPKVVSAICEQAPRLMHTSNLYYTPQQPKLAELLTQISSMDKAFFCNSGAEANEAAIKLVRKAAKKSGNPNKIEIVTAQQSFHGRTMGAVSATAQPKYQEPFEPLVPGFKAVPYNDVESLQATVNENTCAVLLEPVQGESGVHPARREFLTAARELCDKYDAALILDEVQTGLGRTGKMFGFEHYGVLPDVMTLAKTLGGGFPIGCCLARGKWAEVFEPGDHACTFGGSPLACAAALAAVDEIKNGGWVENAERVGAYFRNRLSTLPGIREVRGLGLMIAVEFEEPKAKSVTARALEKGLIVNSIGEYVLRLVPPLTISVELVDRALAVLCECL